MAHILQLIKSKPLDFYIKWAASFIALLHVYLTAHDIAPYYKFSGILNASLWVWLSLLWREPSLILLNTIMVSIYLKGIFGL